MWHLPHLIFSGSVGAPGLKEVQMSQGVEAEQPEARLLAPNPLLLTPRCSKWLTAEDDQVLHARAVPHGRPLLEVALQ